MMQRLKQKTTRKIFQHRFLIYRTYLKLIRLLTGGFFDFWYNLDKKNVREGIEIFKKCNPNPERKRVGDCTIRALAIATEQDWERVFAGLAVKAFEDYDMPSANNVWEEYIKSKGYVKRLLPDTCQNCYTVADFAADHPRGTYILAIGNHVVCVKDGDWCDTWDSGDEVPAYYWEKRKENE